MRSCGYVFMRSSLLNPYSKVKLWLLRAIGLTNGRVSIKVYSWKVILDREKIMKKDYYLYLGKNKKEHFKLPEKWVVSHFVQTDEKESTPLIKRMVLEAFLKPKGTPPLQDLLRGAKRIAFIVDDLTRPTPVQEILKVLFPLFEKNSFPRENITIVIALGTHEALKREELEEKLGSDVLSKYKVIQHNAWQTDLVPVRMPDDGEVVKINPVVAQADLKVGISSILPHPIAGYGGGPKIVMPGVCNFEYIRDHHTKHVIHPRSRIGVTKGNPFHEGCMKAARAIGLDFSINCVYNREGKVLRIIAGSLEMAFEEAVEVCFKKLGHKFDEKVDVTITSTYPHTHGQQIFKGLSAPDIVTREGGAVLLVAPIVAPMPAEFLNSVNVIKEKSQNNPAKYIRETLLKGKAFLPDKPMDYNMAMTNVFLRPKIRAILVSPAISRDETQIIGLEYAPTIEEGLRLLKGSYPEARVAIFPSGGLIVPITAWKQ
jgi:nickel-dependent lactate racemase